MALDNLINKRFGRLVVLYRDEEKPKGHGKPVYWICQCDCGNIKSVRSSHLKSGKIQSCGCLHKETVSNQFTKDITNKRFDLLTAIKPLYINDHNETVWLCKCDCGNLCEKNIGYLTDKRRVSHCGCLSVKSNGEELIKILLDQYNIKYKREFSFPELKGKKYPLRFDFAVFNQNNELKYLIEYNGFFHYNFIKKVQTEERLQNQQYYDELKTEYCEKNNIKLVIINNIRDIVKEKIILEELLCSDI